MKNQKYIYAHVMKTSGDPKLYCAIVKRKYLHVRYQPTSFSNMMRKPYRTAITE